MTNHLAIRHLLLRLRPLHRALRRAVAGQAAAAAQLVRPDLTPLCITDEQVDQLLSHADELAVEDTPSSDAATACLDQHEQAIEQRLRAAAAESRHALPLDRLDVELGLTPFEQDALLLCAAPELDRSYERIYAYVLDDLNRRYPSVELISDLTASGIAQRIAHRVLIGPLGRLRRSTLLESFGETTIQARTQLRLGPGVFEFLTGSNPSALRLWRDPDLVDPAPNGDAVPGAVDTQMHQLGRAVADGTLDVVGLWGDVAGEPEAAAARVAGAAGRPLRRIPQHYVKDPADCRRLFTDAVHLASVLGAMLHVDVDPLQEPNHETAAAALADVLAACDVPIVLSGTEPWRPTTLLAARAYAERELPAQPYAARQALWSAALPEVDPARVDALAGRFRMSKLEVDAVARIARTQARIEGNGRTVAVQDKLDAACLAVARKTRGRFVGTLKPRRGPKDLILPAELHRQVMEIASFSRVLPRVSETWGFARRATGGVGIKALFAGDPGTGKTLAAEVLAGQLGTPLMKVNIGQTVSKWVGETEKNLDAAFREAKANHAVLFFDEADALFGKRGEVRYGVDRYANTEISHLLQRLEDHDGLVILATNLKENIDQAFTRRFHVVVHFPRPNDDQRRRIWKIAFPEEAPVHDDVDLDAMARLDMTGAAITAAARTAALLAADEGADAITMTHVVRAVARQYRRESRILTTTELGTYAQLL